MIRQRFMTITHRVLYTYIICYSVFYLKPSLKMLTQKGRS